MVTGQLFCRLSLHLGFSDVSSCWIRPSRQGFWQAYHRSDSVFFWLHLTTAAPFQFVAWLVVLILVTWFTSDGLCQVFEHSESKIWVRGGPLTSGCCCWKSLGVGAFPLLFIPSWSLKFPLSESLPHHLESLKQKLTFPAQEMQVGSQLALEGRCPFLCHSGDCPGLRGQESGHRCWGSEPQAPEWRIPAGRAVNPLQLTP